MPRRATVLTALFLSVTTASLAADDPCSLVPSSSPQAEGGGDRVKEALAAQARNILFDALKRRGGVWAGRSDIGNAGADMGLDPLVQFLKCKKDCPKGRAQSAVEEFLKGSAKVAFPVVDAVATGGEVVVAGIAYAVDDLYNQTNPGYDVRIANAISFWDVEPMFGRQIRETNIGEKVRSEAELRDLWFRAYGNKIRDFLPGGKTEADTLLDARWPELLKTWQRSRAALVIRQLREDLQARLIEARASSSATSGGPTPPAEIFGLWQSPSGSIVALTSEGGAVVAILCRVSPTGAKLGLKKGDRLYSGGSLSQAAAGEGRSVVKAHSFARAQAGDCPSLAPRDMGPFGVRLAYDPDSDTLEITEQTIKYNAKKCEWTTIKDTPAVNTWNRVTP